MAAAEEALWRIAGGHLARALYADDRAMICYTTPDMHERFMLTDNVLGHFTRHRQIRFWQREAGGQLFARFEPGITLVERATGPRQSDRRSRYSYLPNPEAEQREIYDMHAVGLHYVGD